MKDLLSVVGARPQFVKAAAIDRAARLHGGIRHRLLHTGQHYDEAMSGSFFRDLGIPQPTIDLGVGSGSHGWQTARMMEGIERVLMEARPDALVLYGDTNSTLAASIAAAKLGVPVAHVEAGLRSYNRAMPEEINRVVCDHCSTWLFCPTESAVQNLLREGLGRNKGEQPSAANPLIELSGDVMYDSTVHFAGLAAERSDALGRLGLTRETYLLATVHRDFNTDDPERLVRIARALLDSALTLGLPVILPVHPRTSSRIEALNSDGRWPIPEESPLRIVPPANYLDMIELERSAALVITDSGGVQKEAYFFKRPCVVLRPETEWVELVEHGQAALVDADPERIRTAIARFLKEGMPLVNGLYGDGKAAERIVEVLAR